MGNARVLPFSFHEGPENLPEHDDRKSLTFKSQEENAPWLLLCKRAELLDLFDLCGVLRVNAEFLRLIFESQFVNVIGLDGPVEIVTKEFDERRQRLDLPEPFGAQYAHGFVSSLLKSLRLHWRLWFRAADAQDCVGTGPLTSEVIGQILICMTKTLAQTNPFIKDREARLRAVARNAYDSSLFEGARRLRVPDSLRVGAGVPRSTASRTKSVKSR